MEYIIGNTSDIQKDPSNAYSFLPGGKGERRKDRRKNKQDRRKSVREGIFFSFSVMNDQRVIRDRRRQTC
ncbi:hypothetical protein ACFLZL_01645 [Thermodesulfobacteriota bacterium]